MKQKAFVVVTADHYTLLHTARSTKAMTKRAYSEFYGSWEDAEKKGYEIRPIEIILKMKPRGNEANQI